MLPALIDALMDIGLVRAMNHGGIAVPAAVLVWFATVLATVAASTMIPAWLGTFDIRNRYTEEVCREILLLEPVNDWFLALCKGDPLTADKVEEALDELALLFVLDAEREAIVLVARDKAGRWRTWYAGAIPLAEERYAAYQREADKEEE